MRTISGTLPRGDNAVRSIAKKTCRGADGYREQYGLDSIYLLPVQPLRPDATTFDF